MIDKPLDINKCLFAFAKLNSLLTTTKDYDDLHARITQNNCGIDDQHNYTKFKTFKYV